MINLFTVFKNLNNTKELLNQREALIEAYLELTDLYSGAVTDLAIVEEVNESLEEDVADLKSDVAFLEELNDEYEEGLDKFYKALDSIADTAIQIISDEY